MIPATTMARLATLNLSAEQITAVAEMMAEVEAATETKMDARNSAAIKQRRAADAERKFRQRHVMSADIDGHSGTSQDIADIVPSPPPAPSPRPPTPPAPTPAYNPPSPPSEAQTPKGARSRGSILSDDWQPKPKHFAWAREHGLPDSWVRERAEAMREWGGANRNRSVARKADWDLTFSGFLRRDAPNALRAFKGRTAAQAQLTLVADTADPKIEFGGGYSSPLSNAIRAHRSGKWIPEWGPRFGQPGCKVPQQFWPAFNEAAE